jgi:hypothetical protein
VTALDWLGRTILLFLAVVLAPARESQADIGIVGLEPIKALGLFTDCQGERRVSTR